MRAVVCCILCLCLIGGCCAIEKALDRALADAFRFEPGIVVSGLMWGMDLTDPIYTSNFANGAFLIWDWPRWLAWRISRVVLAGIGFGLFSQEAWEDVGRTADDINLLLHYLFPSS
jgi:hypothetical protein